MFYIYLLLVRNKFGSVITYITKQKLVEMLRNLKSSLQENSEDYLTQIISIIESISKKNEYSELSILVEDLSEEYKTAAFFLIEAPDMPGAKNPFYLQNKKGVSMSLDEIQEHCGNQNIVAIMECFLHSKSLIIYKLKNLIDQVSFNPENTVGIKISEEIAWSKKPGCFEAHLLRKYNNPIFHPSKRVITQKDVDLARERDQKDFNELTVKTNKVIDVFKSNGLNILQLGDLRNEITLLKGRIYEVGGKALDINEKFDSIREIITEAQKDFMIKQNFENAIDVFMSDQDKYKHLSRWHNAFIIQATVRKDSPIPPSELMESVLSEPVETIKLFCEICKFNEYDELKPEIARIAKDMISRNENISVLEEKMILLGISPYCIFQY